MHYITPLAAYSFHSWYPGSQIATQDVLLESYAGSSRFYRCASVSWRQRSRDLALMRSPLPRITCKLGGWPTGLEPATFSRATIRCDAFQSVLLRPVFRLIYGVFGDSEE